MIQIRMRQEFAKIAIHSGPAKLSLETTPPKVNIHSEAAKLEITSPPGKLEIDQSPCRYSIGLKDWVAFAKENVGDAGMKALAEFTAKLVDDGNTFAAIENKTDPIPGMAFDNLMDPEGDLEYVWIDSPKISYRANWPHINVVPGGVTYDPQQGHVENSTQPSKVEISMAQYPSLKIWTVDPGMHFDVLA